MNGLKGYIGLYKGQRKEVYAETKLKAQEILALQFRAKHSYDVTTLLCENEDGTEHLQSTCI